MSALPWLFLDRSDMAVGEIVGRGGRRQSRCSVPRFRSGGPPLLHWGCVRVFACLILGMDGPGIDLSLFFSSLESFILKVERYALYLDKQPRLGAGCTCSRLDLEK